jgi:GT2 family glycosyltransferase
VVPPDDDAQVSVVIVNYQSYDELSRCLAGLGSGGTPLPVVVVDHATDPAAAAAITRQFPHVTLVALSANEGFAAGVNRGVALTRTPLVLLVNPDCVIDGAACRALSAWMREHPDVGAAGPRIHNANGTVQATARRFPDVTTAIAGRSSWLTRVLPWNPLSRRNLPAREEAVRTAMDVDWVSGACLITRRDAFDAVHGMDDGFFLYWEDADYCRRLSREGWRIVYVPHIIAMHVGGRSSRHAAAASQEAFHASAFRLYWKHAGAPARLLAPLVYGALQARLVVMKQIIKRRNT